MKRIDEMSLRLRLGLLVVGTVTVVVLVVSGLSIWTLQRNLDKAMTSKSEAMQGALVRKGVAIARNVALSSSRAIVTGNFTFLVDVVNTTVTNDGEVVYGILMDKSRHALVHSVPELANASLDSPQDMFAAQQTEVATQAATFHGEPVLEVVAPFSVASQPWGVVRFGMSLKTVQNEIANSEAVARQQIFEAILTSVAVTMLLLMIGSFFGLTSATALIKPLQKLSGAADRIRQGDLVTKVEAEGSQEFRALAQGFNAMSEAVGNRETALQGALAQAQEANRLKGDFLANVSHELRTPLNAIINVPMALCQDYETHLAWHCESCGSDFATSADTVIGSDDVREVCPECSGQMRLETRAFYHGDPSQHYHFLQRTLQAAQHLLAVVTDILDFSKLEAGKMTIRHAEVSVRSLFEEVSETVAGLAGAKQQRINWPINTTYPAVWGDSVKIAQILLNLLSNAIKFSDVGGVIDVSVSVNDSTHLMTFAVTDHAMGIPQDKVDSLFQSFRQVDSSHTRAHGGTGLGLAICRKLVELHGGTIWVESQVGVGSTFAFSIPFKPAESSGVNVATGVKFAGKILVVDDDNDALSVLKRFLGDEGYDITCISDPESTMEILGKEQFDVLIVDIMMPKTSGLSLLKRVSAATGNVRPPAVMVTSAYHMNRDIVESLGGVWLPKPWTMDELLERVKQMTGGAVPPNSPSKNVKG